MRQFLGKLERMRVFAVDAKGQELMGRTVHPAMLAKARAMLEQSLPHAVVRTVAGSDGQRYLLFLPSSERFRNAEAGAAPPRGDFGRGMPPGPRMDSPYRTFIPLAAAIAASLLFSFLLAWYFARPIRDLRQAFEAASQGDLAPRFHASGKRGDELTDLGRDFDRMTGRLPLA